MITLKKDVLLIHFALTFVLSIVHGAIDAEIVNKNVDRNIDISTQLVKVSYKIVANHVGNKQFSSYKFIIPEKGHENIAFISVKDFSSKKELKYQESQTFNGYEYEVTFPSTNTQNLHIETVFTKSLIPHPSRIAQNEKQFVRYFGNAYFYSPYPTILQKTIVNIPTTTIEFNTNLPQPVSQSGSRISYGPYENIPRKYLK